MKTKHFLSVLAIAMASTAIANAESNSIFVNKQGMAKSQLHAFLRANDINQAPPVVGQISQNAAKSQNGTPALYSWRCFGRPMGHHFLAKPVAFMQQGITVTQDANNLAFKYGITETSDAFNLAMNQDKTEGWYGPFDRKGITLDENRVGLHVHADSPEDMDARRVALIMYQKEQGDSENGFILRGNNPEDQNLAWLWITADNSIVYS